MNPPLSDLAYRLRQASRMAKAYRKAHPLRHCECGAELENNNQRRCIRCKLEHEAQVEEAKPRPAPVTYRDKHPLPSCACGATVTSGHSMRCAECQKVWRSRGYMAQKRAAKRQQEAA